MLILFLPLPHLYAQVAGFTAPATVYTGSPVTITNTTTGTGTWYWSFCSGNALNDPVGVNIGNPGGLLNVPSYPTLAKDGNTCYTFITNVGTSSVIRYSHGTSYSNNPISWTNLGSMGYLNDSLLGIRVCNDNGQWVGFVNNNNRIVRLSFGTSLSNAPVASLLGPWPFLYVAHCIDVIKDGGTWVGFVTSWGNHKLIRLNFGNSLLNIPVVTDLGSPGAMNFPGVFRIINENGTWYGLVSNMTNHTMTRLTFGSSLLTDPTGVNLGVICPSVNPGGIALIRDCENTAGFHLNYSASSPDKIWRLNFPTGITGTITGTSLGNIGNMTQPAQFSELVREGDTLFLYNTNRQGTLTRLRFLPCSNASVPSSTLFNPPVYSYNQPGTYNVELIVNEGLPIQSSICKNIVVINPPDTAAFTTPDTVCTGSTVNVTNQTATGQTYYWSFCSGNTLSNPLGVNIGNPGALLNIPGYITLVKDGSTCYSFVTNQGNKNVVRYNHGTSFSNNPVSWTNLGGFGMIGDTVEGINFNYDNGQWIAFISNNNRIVRLNFGTSPGNAPTAALLGPYAMLFVAHSINIFNEGGSWVGYVTCSTGNKLVRLTFGNSLLNTPTLTDLGTPGAMNMPTTLRFLKENGTWYGMVPNWGNNTMTRLNFGTSLFNDPTGVNLGVVCPAIVTPGGLAMIRDCENTSGFQLNYSTSSPDLIWRLSFPSGITGPVTGTSLGNIGAMSRPSVFSELFRVGDTLFLYNTNRQNFTLTRLRFLPCTNASVASSTLFTPPPFSYNQPGTYNIQLIVNEGLPNQTSECKNIVVMAPPVVNLGSDRSICPGSSATLDAGAGFYSYLWSTGATTRTITVLAAGTYTVTVTKYGCSASDAVNVTVMSGPNVALGPDVTICSGQSHTFDAGACAGCSFQWGNLTLGQPNIGNGQTYTTGTAGNYMVTVVGPNSCMGRDTAQLVVQPTIPVSITITVSQNPVCPSTQVTITAVALLGGNTPTYQWMVNGIAVGINSPFFSYVPANGDCVVCVLTSNSACTTGSPATSNQICMVVNQSMPAGVSVSTPATTVCAGTPVTLTATPVFGGVTPAYQWKVNATNVNNATNAVYAYMPLNGDIVTCEMTSSEPCATGNPATSLPVTMTVNPNLQVGVTVATPVTTVCAGTMVTFTAAPAFGGATPAYQWKVNAVNANNATNANYAYIPLNGDIVTCMMTSSETCITGNPATSLPVTMTVNPNLPVGVTIGTPATTVCAGTTVTFTATPAFGGTTPAYQWKVNATNANNATNASYAYIPLNGDIITCMMTSSESCTTGNPATSLPIGMTVNPNLPVGVSVSTPVTAVCAGTMVTFTATPSFGGTTPAYQWKVNAVNANNATNAVYAYIPVNGDAVTSVMTSSEACTTGNPAMSIPITMTVNPNLPVGISVGASSNPYCAGSAVTFTATPAFGGTTPAYQWKVNAVNVNNATNASYGYNPLPGDVVSCVLNSSESCTTGNPAVSAPLTMIATPVHPAGITIAASANPFCPGTAVTFTATPDHGGPGPAYQWKVNAGNANNASNASYVYNPVAGDLVSCELTSNLACVTNNPVTSTAILMTTRPVPKVSFTRCFDSITTTNAKPTRLKGGLPPGGTYSGQGVDSLTGLFNPAVAGAGTHLVTYTYTNTYGCTAQSMVAVLTINPVPVICGQPISDPRDNHQYGTFILPSGKCWMSSNLDFGLTISELTPQTDNCVTEKYRDNSSLVTRHSSFYQWDELMQYDNTESAQGICPPGWHIPAAADWVELLSFYNGPGQAAGPLRDIFLANGFHSFQDGFLYQNNTWTFITGMYAGSMYWTSTGSGTDRAVARGINEYNYSISLYHSSRANAFTVRCVKD